MKIKDITLPLKYEEFSEKVKKIDPTCVIRILILDGSLKVGDQMLHPNRIDVEVENDMVIHIITSPMRDGLEDAGRLSEDAGRLSEDAGRLSEDAEMPIYIPLPEIINMDLDVEL